MVTRRINSNLDFLSQIVNEIEELSHWYYAENECEDELLITCRSHQNLPSIQIEEALPHYDEKMVMQIAELEIDPKGPY